MRLWKLPNMVPARLLKSVDVTSKAVSNLPKSSKFLIVNQQCHYCCRDSVFFYAINSVPPH